MSIRIPPDIEQQARDAAARKGVDPGTFVTEAIKKELRYMEGSAEGEKEEAPPSQTRETPEQKTLADLFNGLIGGFRSGLGKERLSENTGEKFTDDLIRKHKEGRL